MHRHGSKMFTGDVATSGVVLGVPRLSRVRKITKLLKRMELCKHVAFVHNVPQRRWKFHPSS